MGVETDRGGTELAAFAGGPALRGRLVLVRGRRFLPTSVAAALLLAAAVGGVLLYGAWRLVGGITTPISGTGATAGGSTRGSGGHHAGDGSGSGGPGVEPSVAGLAEVVHVGCNAHDCRACGAAGGVESEPETGPGAGPAPAPVPEPRPGMWTEERKRPG